MAEMENYLKFCKKNMPKMILQSYKNSTFKQKYCNFQFRKKELDITHPMR